MAGSSTADPAGQSRFYFDFASPDAYLAAEELPVHAEWVPVRAGALAGPNRWDGFRCQADVDAALEAVSLEAQRRELQPFRAPASFPFDSELALRAATYAKGIGRVVAFSLAAFRQAYAGGRALDEQDTIVIAAAACEMHPRAVLQALERDSIQRALDEATAQAAAAGVTEVPALR
jgi:2-hydroxychromene-2-carboxylate isomerase